MKTKKLPALKYAGFMQKIALLSALLLFFSGVSAQTNEITPHDKINDSINELKRFSEHNTAKTDKNIIEETKTTEKKSVFEIIELKTEKSGFEFTESEDKQIVSGKSRKVTDKERFHWKAALFQSGIFLGIQHGS